MGESLAQIKKRYFTEALDKAEKVYLHFVTSEDGVQMPHHLYDQDVVVFVYGHDLPIPVTDFDVDDEGVGATLSFGGTPYYCYVPWKAVILITTNSGEAWPVPDNEYVDVLLGYLMERLDAHGHKTSVKHLDEAARESDGPEETGSEPSAGKILRLLDDDDPDHDDQAAPDGSVPDADASEDDDPDGDSPDDDSPKGPPTLRIIT